MPEDPISPDVSRFPRPVSLCFLAGTLGRGGAERQLHYMIRALADTSIEIRVLCLTRGEALEAEIEALGLPVRWVGQKASRLARLGHITRLLAEDPPNILQSAHFYTNMYVGMAGVALGRPSLGAIRNDLAIEMKANRPFGRGQLWLPRYLIANSRLGRERAIAAGRTSRRVFLVRNAVDTEKFSAGTGKADRDTRGELRLLFVGSLVSRKRPERFLRLLRHLEDRRPRLVAEARVVGTGRDLPALQSLAWEMGLDPGRVKFLNESEDTAPHYRWADQLVLTSDHEGTPNVVLEAMAAGLPVVATSVGGVPDLISRGGGLLVRPDDDEGLLRSVIRLHTDRDLRDRLVNEGLRYVQTSHSLAGLRERLCSIYGAILAR